jgi:hypothetical protein
MQPVLEIKHGRTGYFILSLLSFVFIILFTWLGFFFDGPLNADTFTPEQKIPLGQTIFCSAGILVCSLLFIHWVGRLIKNPSVFSIYKEGFESNTNGVSTGIIKWSNVKRLEEVIVSSNSGSGTRREAVLAVYLKDPEAYTKEQPRLVRFFLNLANRTGRYKLTDYKDITEDAAPIMLPMVVFGKKYDEVKNKMYELSGLKAD